MATNGTKNTGRFKNVWLVVYAFLILVGIAVISQFIAISFMELVLGFIIIVFGLKTTLDPGEFLSLIKSIIGNMIRRKYIVPNTASS